MFCGVYRLSETLKRMFTLGLREGQPTRRVLCLGAHADDIEIGCGGTMLRLAESLPNIEVLWVVFSTGKQRRREALESARHFLAKVSRKTVLVKTFRASFFPYEGKSIKEFFETLKKRCNPDVVFTHYRHDLHQDHRTICELTWNTFRDHFILEYEIPKYDGDLGTPNFFVHLDESLARTKTKLLLECFKTQRNKHWFTEDTFFGLLRLRGIESNAPEKYAEAFYCRKLVF